MEKIIGFIVEVKQLDLRSVDYIYDGALATLEAGQTFTGYFWQMTGKNDSGIYENAHITKIRLVDTQNLLFCYEKEAIFDTNLVEIRIKAKRGPDSNNKYLPKEYDQYDTWNAI